jgi:Zn-finger nucleic acid-binding protein
VALACPGCGRKMENAQVHDKRACVCQGCGGVVIMIAPLRQIEGQLAQRLWTAPMRPEAGRRLPCPYCGGVMEDKAAATGEVARCLPCEALWLDKAAFGTLPAPPGPVPLGLEELKCPECGAPLGSSGAERCRYCGAALKAPVKVVVVPQQEGGGPGAVGGGAGTGWVDVAGATARMITRILGH